MAPNRMFEQLTDKTKKNQEILKNFQATTCNESLQSPPPPPSRIGFNIQASMMKIVTSERRESPELVSRKLEMAPKRMFQQLTYKRKKVYFLKRSTRMRVAA